MRSLSSGTASLGATIFVVAIVGIFCAVNCAPELPRSSPSPAEDDVKFTHLPQQADELRTEIESKINLDKIFDFVSFRNSFGKSYSSLIETLARKRSFLANAMKVAASALKYITLRSNYYLSINMFSDLTDAELMEVMHSDQVLENSNLASWTQAQPDGFDGDDGDDGDPDAPSTTGDNFDLDSAHRLESIRSQIDAEASMGELSSSETIVMRGKDRKFNIRDIIKIPFLGKTTKPDGSHASPTPPSPPPLTAPINQPPAPPDITLYKKAKLGAVGPAGSVGNNLMDEASFPTPAFYGWLSPDRTDFFGRDLANKRADMPEYLFGDTLQRTGSPENELISIDHRKSGCLSEPRNQIGCGACYAFAMVALAEYYYCRQTGQLVEFSEQYMVDCGKRVGLNGCRGGSLDGVYKFVELFGFELRSAYGYLRGEDQCPYSADTSLRSTGRFRLENPIITTFPANAIGHMLKFGPIWFIVRGLSTSFDRYGGGVYYQNKCENSNSHGLVIVGQGQLDGEDYWLIRNSYGPKWGEEGYVKMSIEFVLKCGREEGHLFGYYFSKRYTTFVRNSLYEPVKMPNRSAI